MRQSDEKVPLVSNAKHLTETINWGITINGNKTKQGKGTT